jgi:Leucine-rich repeat (LRR) protein
MTPEVSTLVAKPTPFRRCWFRYSVRSFLIFTTLAAVVLGLVLKERNQSASERMIGEELQKFRAVLSFRGPYDAWELYESSEQQSWWRKVERRVLGERIFEVAIYGAEFSDLTPIAGLENLRQLRLKSTALTDLTPLDGLENLQRLRLESDGVTEITTLAGLKNLQELYLNCPAVRDLTPLDGLEKLQRLVLNSVGATDITPVAGLKSLNELDLINTAFSDDQIESLQEALPNCVIVW